MIVSSENILLSNSETLLKPTVSFKQFSGDFEAEPPTNNCDQGLSNSSNSKNKDSSFLSKLRIKNANRLIIGNLNINSIFNKFDQLKAIISKYSMPFCLISEIIHPR